MVPIAIQNGSQETYPLDTFIDNVYTPADRWSDLGLTSENAQIVDEAEHSQYEEISSLLFWLARAKAKST